jgi:hypothetical protein
MLYHLAHAAVKVAIAGKGERRSVRPGLTKLVLEMPPVDSKRHYEPRLWRKAKYSRDLLRFAAALVVCLVRKLAHELPVLNRTAARFHFFASVVADHLLSRSGESSRNREKSSREQT